VTGDDLTRPGGSWPRASAFLVSGILAACSLEARPDENPAALVPPTAAIRAVTETPFVATPAPSVVPSATVSPSPTPAVLIAAGDISTCGNDGDEATALLVEARDGTVAVLGDSVYDSGTAQEFAECYEPTWGRFKDRTHPAVGNHEYLTPGATGYFDYFGASAGPAGLGYYSYDLGAWHIVVINSVCWEVGGCTADDPQAVWLANDLRQNPASCTLAYWHFPRFSSGLHGSTAMVDAYWRLLYDAGADVVLTGHDHTYERFAPQDSLGYADPERGLREFVVGTGGASHYGFPVPLANSEARNADTFGVLVLTLHPDRYEWEFVPVADRTYSDQGAGTCHP
jgi:hypothetical protein